MDLKNLHFDTLQIHAGLDKTDPICSRGIGIHPTAAYRFPSCGYAADLFELSQPGNIYTRLQNPTTSAYEERIAALYGGSGALAVSSGISNLLSMLITITIIDVIMIMVGIVVIVDIMINRRHVKKNPKMMRKKPHR